MVVDVRRVENFQHEAAQTEGREGYEVRDEAVGFVGRDVSSRRDGASGRFSRHEAHQEKLEGGEREDELTRRAGAEDVREYARLEDL